MRARPLSQCCSKVKSETPRANVKLVWDAIPLSQQIALWLPQLVSTKPVYQDFFFFLNERIPLSLLFWSDSFSCAGASDNKGHRAGGRPPVLGQQAASGCHRVAAWPLRGLPPPGQYLVPARLGQQDCHPPEPLPGPDAQQHDLCGGLHTLGTLQVL